MKIIKTHSKKGIQECNKIFDSWRKLDVKNPVSVFMGIKLVNKGVNPVDKIKMQKNLKNYIEIVLPETKKINGLADKLMYFNEWKKKYLGEFLDGNKVLKFIKGNNLNEFVFMACFGGIINFRENIDGSGGIIKDKGFDKLREMYKDYYGSMFGEDYAEEVFGSD